MNDPGLVREVVVAVEALIVEPRGGTVSGGGKRARPVGTRDYLGREVVDRHFEGEAVRFRPAASQCLFAARRYDV
jgi:hypothetical protein